MLCVRRSTPDGYGDRWRRLSSSATKRTTRSITAGYRQLRRQRWIAKLFDPLLPICQHVNRLTGGVRIVRDQKAIGIGCHRDAAVIAPQLKQRRRLPRGNSSSP
jgi:hypothetical protein